MLVNRIAPLLCEGGRLINLSSAGHRFSNVNLDDPNFERTPYDPFVAYGRSKTANILFAVAFDKRHRGRGVRAAGIHREAFRGAFQFKTIRQDAATSVWAAVVVPPDEVGGQYYENCHVGRIVSDDVTVTAASEGVRGYALDPKNAETLWDKSEEMVGESF